MLRRLRLQFTRFIQKRQQRDVDEKTILTSDLITDLAYRLNKRLPLHVADRTADFRNDDVDFSALGDQVDVILDFVDNVRDDLYRAAIITSRTFAIDHVKIHATRRDIAFGCQIYIGESLVMTDIEVCLRPVLRHENFTVLCRIHECRVDIDIRIEFLNADVQSPRDQQSTERCRREPLS
jgi:hypothetical protein